MLRHLTNLMRDIKCGRACQYIRKEDRVLAEKALEDLETLLNDIDNNVITISGLDGDFVISGELLQKVRNYIGRPA